VGCGCSAVFIENSQVLLQLAVSLMWLEDVIASSSSWPCFDIASNLQIVISQRPNSP